MLRAVEVHSKVAFVPKLVLQLLGNDGLGPFHIRDIVGLGPVKSTVNSRGYGSLDGEFYTGSHVGKRNIVITLGLNPGEGLLSVEATRRLLYAYWLPKMNTVLRFISDGRPAVQIEGYVESLEPNMFSKDPEIVVSIICPKPHFESVDVKTVTGVASRTPLDSGFLYNGDITNGIVLTLVKSGVSSYNGPVTVESGILGPSYRKFEVKAYIQEGIHYQVNSHQGLKTVETRLTAENTRFANLMKSMTEDSLWPYVVPGTNKVRVKIDSDNGLPWTLYYIERFGGL